MTDRFVPAGLTAEATPDPIVTRVDFMVADTHGQTTVMGMPGFVTLERVTVTRGQAWPQGVPRKTGYTP